jgi:hypothetical protein
MRGLRLSTELRAEVVHESARYSSIDDDCYRSEMGFDGFGNAFPNLFGNVEKFLSATAMAHSGSAQYHMKSRSKSSSVQFAILCFEPIDSRALGL